MDTWREELIHWKRLWCWEGLGAGREGDDRGWDGWMASLTRWMWGLDYKESWEPKNWCFWTMVLEKTLVSPLDCKEIQPVHPKGDQSWVFIERTDNEAETPKLLPPDEKSWLIWKDPDAGKDWGQEEKRATEDEMVGWHHQPNAHELEQTPEDREAWHPAVYGVTKSQTWLSNWTVISPVMYIFFLWFSLKHFIFFSLFYYSNTL